jgi:predicted enzyme related to lactoylglutathione lyase
MPRVVHFEIHAENPERAIQFYNGLFAWEFTRWPGGTEEYWLVKTGPSEQPGIDGGLVRRRGPLDGQAVTAFVCTVDVPSIDATLAAVPQRGGTIALPKMPIPGVGWLAYAKDTEGNIFGFMQADPGAR